MTKDPQTARQRNNRLRIPACSPALALLALAFAALVPPWPVPALALLALAFLAFLLAFLLALALGALSLTPRSKGLARLELPGLGRLADPDSGRCRESLDRRSPSPDWPLAPRPLDARRGRPDAEKLGGLRALDCPEGSWPPAGAPRRSRCRWSSAEALRVLEPHPSGPL